MPRPSAISRAWWTSFQAALFLAGAASVFPLVLGRFLLAGVLFVGLFGTCWMLLGPVLLLVAGVVDSSRALERAVHRRRQIRTYEASAEAGQVAIASGTQDGRVSPAGPSRYR